MKKILEIKDLSIAFQTNNGIFKAVRSLSFDLQKGEILGVVGESGSGKSLTALSILNLLPQNAEISSKSSIMFCGQNLMNLNYDELRKIRGGRIGFIFQEPMSSLNPLHKVGAQIAESVLLHQQVNAKQANEKAIELMKTVGIKNAEERFNAFPFELSGGQRQRIMIAMAIANNPDVLIADEPTTALDVTIQKQIIELLIDLKNKLGMAVIFISHDLNLVSKIADRILVMYHGRKVEEGTTEQIFNAPRESYTKKLINSSLSLKNIYNNCSDKLLSVQDLVVEYPVKKSFLGKTIERIFALNHVSFDLYQDETLGIVGESGSGKTTLGMALAKLIKYQGKIITKQVYKSKEFRKKLQIVFQDPYNSLNPRLNVLEIVGEGLKIHYPDFKPDEIKVHVQEILCEVGLNTDILYKYPHEFSGGERQRLSIARALILRPEIVVLDEPTSALDVTVQAQIIELLKKLQKKYRMTYIFISHDMRAICSMSDRVAVMKDGQIVELDSCEQIFNHPKNQYTKTLIDASVI